MIFSNTTNYSYSNDCLPFHQFIPIWKSFKLLGSQQRKVSGKHFKAAVLVVYLVGWLKIVKILVKSLQITATQMIAHNSINFVPI